MSEEIIDWKKIDWTKSNIVIAQETGRCRFTVFKQRKKHGQPISRLTKWENVDWTKRNSDIAKELGVAVDTVCHQRNKRKIKCSNIHGNSKYPKRDFNWNLSNKDLKDIWRLSDNYAGNLRVTENAPAAKWDARHGLKNRNNPEYNNAIEQEKLKAAKWRRSKK